MAQAPSTQPYVTAEGLEREWSIPWTPKSLSWATGMAEGAEGVKQERMKSGWRVAGAVLEALSGTDVPGEAAPGRNQGRAGFLGWWTLGPE